MEIVFKNHKVRKQIRKRTESSPIANRRLKQIENAPCFIDIPASAKAHFLEGDLRLSFAVDFGYPTRLICVPFGEFETNNEGQYIKESIKFLKIIKIEQNYH